ncbi:alpha/beta hydrolase [Gordonia hydrophobica]|uniref:Alpha/beta hydrolase n=1 Tax=Gordonia hydrophobica TaxID=40516 RepID=A0ABZ2U979_9ACTN|nr:alpha/beta hydrolase [Gordonia hydrophobica]MBM7365415.1 pimeloyl-ACP methyl ester carboxylesterase [Gordonia hydrophobica]
MESPQASVRYDFPIRIVDGQADHLSAFFTAARGRRTGILQILVHGVSYDHRYWDAGRINGVDYSYANYMAAQGFDVLAVDLPGVGASSRTNGGSVTIDVVVDALSGLIGRLREGPDPLGREFAHICLVGHSMGAALSVCTQAATRSADSVIVTGTGFSPIPSGSGWPDGTREKLLTADYALVPPELRRTYYHFAQTDPAVFDFDNRELRTPLPSSLWEDCIRLRANPNGVAGRVDCPVYLQLGGDDPIMPGAYAEQEGREYAASAEIVTESIPDIGHCFNLHLNHEASWRAIVRYLQRHVPA